MKHYKNLHSEKISNYYVSKLCDNVSANIGLSVFKLISTQAHSGDIANKNVT